MSKKLTLDELAKEFPIAYAFIKKAEEGEWNLGRTDLEDGYFALVQKYNSKERSDCKFEAHEKYLDIQYVSKGKEAIGILPIEECKISVPYNPEKDVVFFEDDMNMPFVELNDGEALVLYPEDGHMPGMRVAESVEIKKIVIKVPVK